LGGFDASLFLRFQKPIFATIKIAEFIGFQAAVFISVDLLQFEFNELSFP